MKPVPALLICPPLEAKNGRTPFTDAMTIRPVLVEGLNREAGQAYVRQRVGSTFESRWVSFAHLASTPEEAVKKLQPILSALAGRAPQTRCGSADPGAVAEPQKQ